MKACVRECVYLHEKEREERGKCVCDLEIGKDEWLRASTSEFLLEDVCRKDSPTKTRIFLKERKEEFL